MVTCNVSQADAQDVVLLVLLAFLIQIKRIPRKINILKGPGNEYPQHLRAKERLGEILKASGYYNISYEVQQPKTMLELLGERTYIADVQAEKEGRIYIFEVDGKKGHTSRWNLSKDKARDRAMFAIGRWTIRIPVGYLGKGFSDSEILEEIEWQLTNIQTIEGNKNALSVINC